MLTVPTTNKGINQDEILVVFCIIDDTIKALGIQGYKQQEISERKF